jgi:hypothetical protein
MQHAVPAGVLALPLVLFGGSLALVATAVGTPARDAQASVELELAGVLPLPDGNGGILVLREKGSETILPLIVPDGRGSAPAVAGGGLLGRTIHALGGRVAQVEIDRTDDTSAGARVRLAQGAKQVELEAVPSESVALAVAEGVPIVTTRRLLEEEGLSPEDLARAHAKSRGSGILRLRGADQRPGRGVIVRASAEKS